MTSPFEIDIGGDIPDTEDLSQEAQELWGIKKEQEVESMVTKVEPQEEKVVNSYPTLTIDSPKEMWDVLGHIAINCTATTEEAILQNVAAAQKLWATLREEFADEFEEVARKKLLASDGQRGFLADLYEQAGEEVPDDLEDMTKAEASREIQRLQGDSAPQARQSRSTGRSRGGSRQQSGGFTLKNPDAPASDAQLDKLEDLAKKAGEDLPDGYEDFTMQEASDEIQRLMGSSRRNGSSSTRSRGRRTTGRRR